MQGEIEIDESYFGAKRVRGKREGVELTKKTPVFLLRLRLQLQAEGMLKRNGYVWMQIVKDYSASELLPLLRDCSDLAESIIYSDTWKAYDGLVYYGAKTHYRVKHSKNEFALGRNHINGIEIFFTSLYLQL